VIEHTAQKYNYTAPQEKVFAMDIGSEVGTAHGDNYYSVAYHDGHVRGWLDRQNALPGAGTGSYDQQEIVEANP
jgi:hypothetical protein